MSAISNESASPERSAMTDSRAAPLFAFTDTENRNAVTERQGCPCCGSPQFHVIVREPYASRSLTDFVERHYEGRASLASLRDAAYEIVRCPECTLAYQRTIPNDDLLNEIYDDWIPPSEKGRLHRERGLDDYCYLSEQIQFLVQHLALKPYEIRVLDFGMGWAEWATMARAFGCQVAGTELSLHRARHAESLGIEVIDWEAIGRRKFHFINTEQVFEHLITPLPILKRLAAALEENGLIRIAVPDCRAALRALLRRASFSGLSEKQIVPVAPLEHVNCFEYRSLAALAENAGLQVARPKLRHLYNSSSGWLNFKNAARLALRPIYRHVVPKSTVQYFCGIHAARRMR